MSELDSDVLEHLPCGYVRTTRSGHITRANAAFVRMTGLSRAELEGKRLSDLFSVGCRIYYETHFAPLLAMQGFVDQLAMDVRHASGSTVPVLVNAVRHTDASGGAVDIHTVVDVSERRSYEKELLLARERAERAAQARADFVSMFSHEIRTPLNAIVGVAQLLAATSDASQTRLVGILKRSSDGLLALVNEILDYSKIEAGKVTLEERRLDVREVAHAVAQALEGKAAEKQIAMRVSVDDRVPRHVVGDPVKLGQILTNLVGNATKFTPAGTIEIRVERLDDSGAGTGDGGDGGRDAAGDPRCRLRVAVRDTGIGIAPDRLSTIFDDYAQGGYEIGARYGGTGLGLAIVKRLVELHGSKIEVTSEPGQGSTFWFDAGFRVVSPDERLDGDETDARADAPEASLSGLRALVVDDSDVNLVVMRDLLEGWDMIVDTAASGREAIDKAKEARHDVVLMDLNMPDLDGHSAARAIRELGGAFSTLPIIAVSGSTRFGARDVLVAGGFSDFVGKPMRPDVLAAAIQRHTQRE